MLDIFIICPFPISSHHEEHSLPNFSRACVKTPALWNPPSRAALRTHSRTQAPWHKLQCCLLFQREWQSCRSLFSTFYQGSYLGFSVVASCSREFPLLCATLVYAFESVGIFIVIIKLLPSLYNSTELEGPPHLQTPCLSRRDMACFHA